MLQTIFLITLFTATFALSLVYEKLDLPSSPQRYSTDVDKRDIEHALFLTPPNSIAYMLELPRTDRKKLNREMLEQLHTTFAYE